ncbi:hypothetical protein L195_g044137 [Trifolium pratense]|uniref:Uncharacterized protein n=1 Tax=Trifolium pratense TaxID=57577 RepID=A0A2K3MB77_TRIPR|nr:hypothetical protein L195_g044137 [Trifolium pratense]
MVRWSLILNSGSKKSNPAQENRTSIYNSRTCAMRRPLRPGAKRQLQLRCGAAPFLGSFSRCSSCAMRSSSAPWRSLQCCFPSTRVNNAPCAANWRRGAAYSLKGLPLSSQMRHAQPCGAMAQTSGEMSLKKRQHCAMRSLLRPGAV